MLNFIKKLQKNKKIFQATIFIIIIVLFFVNIKFVMAATDELLTGGNIALGVVGGAVSMVLSLIAYILTAVIGLLITVVVALLIQVAQFGNIINVPTVIQGWVIIRDLCNMLFILILLIVAFATILRVESYQWKKILPKLLIMAVLINFSRTIFGLLVDFSQVIMLTFVNSFRAGGGWFIEVFRTNMLLTIKGDTSGDFAVTTWTTALTIIAGVIAAIITLIVVSVMLAILVMRIIMLWIYTIFSPLVFMGFAVPAIQKYTGKIWEDFIKQLVVGPVLAFFIWLALTTASKSSGLLAGQNLADKASEVCLGVGSFFCTGHFQDFIIVIGLLMGGLMVAQQMGGAAASIAGKGLDWAKKSSKFVGKAVGYVPAQYAKKAGYGLGDMALGQLKKAPIIGSLALEGQARLKMHRDFAEEKDTKYMQYLEEQDLDRIIARQRSTSIISTLGKGMESKRQMFKRALVEKMKRGDEWGQTMEEKRSNKTRAMIDLAQIGGHSITSSGEDAFREADLLKLWHEFRNKNAGVIDDNEMRLYFFGGTGASGRNYKGIKGAANSEYYRVGGWQDPGTGFYYDHQDPATGQGVDFVSPNSMLVYTLSRMRMNEVHNLHHENFVPRTDALGENYDAFEAIYDDGNGAMRSLAQIRDRGTRQQKRVMRAWMAHRLTMEQTAGYTGSTYFSDLFNDYQVANPGATQEQFIIAAMGNGGVQGLAHRDRLGGSRAIMGQTHSTEVASDITGLNRVNRGVLAANFSELGLEKVAAKYFDGADKAEIASRIGSSLRENGMAESVAKAVEEQINKASYLILHNKEAGVSLTERNTSHAHELMHARVGANFSQDELKGVWNSMDENSKNSVRKQISAKWGGNMSEEAIMNEYFAEGLTAKTRWGKGAVLSLNQTAESGLDHLLKAKGSNINAFTSNVIKTRPTSNDIRQSMVNNVDGSLKDTLDELIGALKDVGNGFNSIENFSSNLGSLQRSMERNRTSLDKSVRGYKEVTDKLNNLANKTI